MLVEVFGEQATISRTTASRICQRLRAEFDTWRRRDLAGTRIDYLYLDGSFFKMHPRAKAEPVLVAWGIDTDGKPCLLGLAPGAAESTDAWRGLLADLGDRGLGAPLLVISDGGKGLGAAIECSYPNSLHQRCLVHLCRNLTAKVPTHAQGEVKRDYWRSSTTSSRTARPPSPRPAGAPSGSSPSGSRCTPPRSPVWPTTSTRSPSTCCSRPSTASASATPT
jgi:putative transposase